MTAVTTGQVVDRAATPAERSRWGRALRYPETLAGILIVVLLFAAGTLAPWLAPYGVDAQSSNSFAGASARHLLGTDEFGRDVFSRVLFGIRQDVVVAGLAVPAGALLGTALGLLSGLHRLLDSVVQRAFDVLLSFTALVMGVAVSATAVGPGLTAIVVTVVLVNVPLFGRLTRSAVNAQRGRDYVVAAEVIGARPARVLLRHILPNALDSLIVQAALSLSMAVFIEGAMSFVGIGIRPPAPSLGGLLRTSTNFLDRNVFYALGPIVVVTLLVLGFNLVADGLNRGLLPSMTTSTFAARPVTASGALLGESPRWDDRTGRLVWVDLWGGLLQATDPSTGQTRTTEVAPPLSSAVLTTGAGIVVTQGLCVLEVTEDGVRHLTDLPEQDCLRANDAAVDPAGRLLIGTMYLPGRAGASGGLWRWEPDDETPVRLLDSVGLANGIGWSPEGDRMYFVDSARRLVTAYAYDVGSGRLAAAEPFVEVTEAGTPDGIAVATDGSVWVALAGGGALQRYATDGALIGRVEVPVRFPTSCAFGGSTLSELFVTTGSRQVPLPDRAAAVDGGAGALFRVATDLPGLPTNRLALG